MNKETYVYKLPIGLSLREVEKIQDELQVALNATVEIEGEGNHFTLNVYRGKLPKRIKYQAPEPAEETLLIPIGYNISGELVTLNLASDSHPYLLVGGNPGTGKSVFLNGCIASLCQYPPEWVQFVLIDMKLGVELSQWEDYPHTWLKAYDPEKPDLPCVLGLVDAEIRKRMKIFKEAGVKKISEYHALGHQMNYLVIIIDEFAELKNSVNGDEYEEKIKSVLQIGRAAGLRCISATQRPTVDNISGSIKALMTDRLAFSCATALNSRVILDTEGAEKLPNDVPGRGIFLTGAKFQQVQVMEYI